jgi:general secretion pathway protein D
MTKPPLASTIASLLSLAILTPTLVLPSPVFAGPSGGQSSVSTTTESVVAREQARRRDYVIRAEAAIETASRAYREKDYETAVAQYKLACDLVTDAPNSGRIHDKALDGFSEASIKLAEQRITEGRYADAENLCKQVLSENYNPRYKPAVVLLSRLETPGYFNRTIGPKFRGNVEEVKKLLLEAQGFYDTARYDLAFKRCEQVLNFDNYNMAARKMQEKINLQRDNYAVVSYNEARSRAMWQTDHAWANPVRKFGLQESGVIIQENVDAAGTARINAKLNYIIIPRLEFKDATIREAVDFLKKKSVDLDTRETDPTRRGVNIVLKLEPGGGGGLPGVPEPAPVAPTIPGLPELPGATPAPPPSGGGVGPGDVRITVSLTNIPLIEALRYVTSLANLKFKVEPYAVSIVPAGTSTETLLTREFKVPPGFINRAAGGGGAEAGGLSPTAPASTDTTKGGSGIAARVDAKEFLTASGVTFPTGATAIYNTASSRLIVRNTQENLDFVETLIAAGSNVPAQVEIEAKFVEITQNNLKELSFDWLLGQFNIPGSSSTGVFAGGGSSGTGPKTNPTDFPFPINNGNYTTFPVTGGNRSGGVAISANAIDSLLFGSAGASQLAPAIAGIAGIMTDPSFQLVIRALNQKKGVDLLSAPKVTTKSGQRAVIEIIREFRYPTEFDPPQIPQNFGSVGTTVLGTGLSSSANQGTFPVTPTTPTSFETRNTGVTLEVEPQVGPDGYTIDLQLVPQVVEFEGFINYGSPIQTTSTNLLGVSTTNVITPNVINQPIFSTRKVTTSVSIFDGQTVLLGGLIREDVQKVEDKTPFLGDLPLIGRLFRSSVDQHLKRHLVIFVSARLINPAGEAVRSGDEKEEEVETLALPEAQAELPLMPK